MNDDLKADCHKYLDMLWTTKEERNAVYRWLAFRMKMPRSRCHISRMNLGQLYKARRILRREWVKRRKRRVKN